MLGLAHNNFYIDKAQLCAWAVGLNYHFRSNSWLKTRSLSYLQKIVTHSLGLSDQPTELLSC